MSNKPDMSGIVISIGAKIAELLVVPIGKHILYPFKYKSNMEKLTKQVEKLTFQRELLQHSVDEAKRQGYEIEKLVERWMNSVDEFTNGVVKSIIDDQVKAGKLCSICFFPNLMARYSLSRKAAKTTKAGVVLSGEGKFERVSYSPPLQKTTSIYIRDYGDFDSRKPVFDDLMEALRNADVNLIGVYGMGGVGKTTLVKKVVVQVQNDKLFDEVVMAEVTEAPDIKIIQGQIADQLGLRFNEESNLGRAARLRERIKKENRILVILDNVWAKLDLDSIGIPITNDEKGSIMQKLDQKEENTNKRQCKLLLTSRSLDVLYNDMNTQKNFKVEILSDAEAESLFRKTAGYSEEKSDLNPIAVDIVGKCAGLPIAIKTIANALKNKSLPFWKNALDRLKKANPKDIKGMDENVYSTIELSFEFLKPEKAKSLFLLCSLCNAGYSICITDLLKYGMGLGLFQDANTLEAGRNELHILIDVLKTSCLLMDDDVDSDFVKMHDIIHFVAVSIASNTKRWFNLPDSAGLKEMLEKKLPKDSAAVSLPYRDIYELPERMEFPKLEIFMLFMKDASSLQVPDAVFEGMKDLKVIDICGIQLLSPPSSLCCLINLQTLCLVRCQLKDVAIIGELKELEILSFSESDIEQLPGEIGQLTRLKLLDLSRCSKLEIIKPNVISSLICLEELYMGNSFVQWDVEGGSNASLAELKQLSHLTALDIHVFNAEIIPRDLSFGKLERYQIYIGDVWDWSEKSETSKMLKLQFMSSSIYLRNEIKSLLNRTEALYLHTLKGVKNVVNEVNGKGLPQLKHLRVQNGFEIQYIANSIGLDLCNIFPRLESLFLDNLINLEKICHGQLETMSFNNLRIMKVRKCDRLKHLFPFSMTNKLLQLQKIEVTDCKNLEEIIFKESEELIQQVGIEFTQLRTLTLECLPQLTSFAFNTFTPDIGSQEIVAEDESSGFTSLFSQNVELPSLENLKLSSITVQSKWLDQFPVMSSCSQALTNLTLEECNGLKFLFSYSMLQSLVQLQNIEIRNCKSIEGIINMEELRGEGKMIFPKLYRLDLEDLPKLTSFCKFVGNLIELPSLAVLLLENCPKMHAFVSASPHADILASKEEQMNSEKNLHSHVPPLFDKKVRIPDLKYLRIGKMDNVRKIWHHQLTPDTFSKIDYFGVFDCHNLLNVFPSNMLGRLQKLDVLVVSNCKSVEAIFEEHDISSCMVEEIVANPENVKAVPKLVFPRLTLLKLADLPRLRILYTGLYISQWPMLKTLRMWGCKKVEKLTSKFCSLQETHVESQHVQQPLFIVDKLFPNLEELSLEWNYIAKEMLNGNFSGYSSKLKDLYLIDASKTALCPCFLLYTLPNLEKLVVTNGVLDEMFICEGLGCKEKCVEAPSKLNYLRLVGLNDPLNLGEVNSLLRKILHNLMTLEVSKCDKLKTLMSPSMSFQNLTTLEVWKSDGLINLMAILTAKSLVQLTRLKIIECKMIEEIIIHGGDREENTIIFNKLEYLELCYLPRLKSFYTGNYAIEFPSLQQVVVRQCPNMEFFSLGALSTPRLNKLQTKGAEEGFWEGSLNTTIQKLFEDMDRFRGIENFTLSDFPYLKEVWVQKHFLGSYFSNLKSLVVDDKYCCLRYIFTPSVALGLVQLQELQIKNCAILEEIIVIGEEITIGNTLFPNLNSMELIDLLELTSFCNFARNVIELPSLTRLWIKNCPNMQTFISNSRGADMSTSEDIKPLFDEKVQLPNLNFLLLEKMDKLRKIWHCQLPSDSFCKITTFGVHDCHNVLNVFPSNMFGILQKLDRLWLTNCSSLDEIFELEASSCGKTQAIQLRKLVLKDLPKLKHIWDMDSQGLLITFQNLLSIKVIGCDSLKCIFPASVGRNLLQLEKLQIQKCSMVEEIFAKNEVVPRFVFPQLRLLKLWQLSRLKSFYPEIHILEWPMLKHLEVWKCDKVAKIFASEILSFQMAHRESHDMPIEPALFLVDKVRFTNLENLALDWNWFVKEALHENFHDYSCKLQVLGFRGFHKETGFCVCCFLHKLPNLEKVRIYQGFFKEVFLCEGLGCEEKHLEAPSKLRHLRLYEVFDSLPLGEENSGTSKVFQNLASLEVAYCSNLKSLVSSSVSFQNLTTLEVLGCNELLSLVAVSTTKSMVQLTKLIVFKCKMIKEIIKHEGNEVEDCIIFKKLRYLELECLPSLTSFYFGNHTIEFPSLQQVVVTECQNMKIFSRGTVRTPRLHRLQTTEAEGEGFGEGNLNTAIEHLFIKNGQNYKEN